MAKENIGQFYTAVFANENRRKQFEEMGRLYSDREPSEAERIELVERHLIPMASEMGYGFTFDELRDYEKEMLERNNNSGELSVEELDAVAGGLTGVNYFSVCVILGFSFITSGLSACSGIGI